MKSLSLQSWREMTCIIILGGAPWAPKRLSIPSQRTEVEATFLRGNLMYGGLE